MNTFILCIGSNFEREQNTAKAVKMLKDTENIGCILFSRFVSTKAVGIASDDFLNGIAQVHTLLSHTALQQHLKEIERRIGRTSEDKKRGIIRIDIDIIAQNGTVLKEDFHRDYVQSLMKENNF